MARRAIAHWFKLSNCLGANVLHRSSDRITGMRCTDVTSPDAGGRENIVQRFDYNASAELFPTRRRKGSRASGYRRFATAAEAIRYAIEDLSPELLIGAHLQVEERRFDCDGIRRLYESTGYPLERRSASAV